MTNKTKLPKEVQDEIKLEAEGYANRHVNGRAQPELWEIAFKANENGATAYATKLHEAQQENDRLKAIANLWRPLMEEAIRQDSLYGHVPIETINKIKRFLYGE